MPFSRSLFGFPLIIRRPFSTTSTCVSRVDPNPSNKIQAHILNISPSGIGLATKRHFDPGTRLRLELVDPSFAMPLGRNRQASRPDRSSLTVSLPVTNKSRNRQQHISIGVYPTSPCHADHIAKY